MTSGPPHSFSVNERRSFWRRLLDAALSLQCKATGLVVVLTLSVTATVSGYLLQSSEKFVREQHDTQMVQLAAMLAKTAAVTLVRGDLEALHELAAEAANGTPLLYVVFSDVEGRQLTVAEHGNANVLQSLGRGTLEGAPVPGRPVLRAGNEIVPVFLDVTYPISTRPLAPHGSNGPSPLRPTKLLGYVRIGMVGDSWYRTMSSRLDLLVGVGVLAAVVVLPLGFLLIRRIVSPLEELADVMHQFSQGELKVRSVVHRRDEIGRLAAAFNRMADQHQHTHERTLKLNVELEKRVAQRTLQLRELASREPLTGLYNRRHFNEMLERRFSEALRYEGDLSCIMLDLDGFKAVNDAFGHHIGDELLVLTATTITSQLRTADVAARFGGDEFIVQLPQTDADRAHVLGERIIEKFTHDVAERLPQVCVSISMGITSLSSSDVKDAEALIRAADHALYDAKAAGKNRIITGSSVSRPVPI